MSEIKLNLVDVHTILAGTIHGSVGDACIAALTAEPETIAELEAALARYIKPSEHSSRFASFRTQSEIDARPHDAGLMVIDLAARVVAVESTYSNPGPEGEVHYHNGKHATDIPIRYLLDSEWLFVHSVESYRWSAQRRRAARLARTQIDYRAVLYGRPMLQFIVDFQNGLAKKGFTLPPTNRESAEAVADEIVKAHAAWLTTTRTDLGGRAPREVMLEKRRLIEFDLDSRGWQWSMQGEGPPCLPVDSHAYRYGGFGTHEWVVYYDLVRHLFCVATLGDTAFGADSRTGSDSDLVSTLASDTCDSPHSSSTGSDSDRIRTPTSRGSDRVPSFANDQCAPASLDVLQRFASTWLDTPQPNYDNRTPAIIIDNERRRLPITMTPEQLMIDEDCECCQMLARDAANGEPTFWHLDGCNMEEEFAFSWCLTIQEWEAEQRRHEELGLEFARRDAEQRDWDRQHLEQIMSESDPDLNPGVRREFDPDDWEPLELNSHDMAELIQKMKRTHRLRSIRIADEDDEFQSPIKRNEPVN
ncbi:MAG TPA: hypothetical protein VJU84_16425 [Pyrinomonadaceae bacterium]|nr:hypothetical protein [Pyrinomonadaceae bacterium]